MHSLVASLFADYQHSPGDDRSPKAESSHQPVEDGTLCHRADTAEEQPPAGWQRPSLRAASPLRPQGLTPGGAPLLPFPFLHPGLSGSGQSLLPCCCRSHRLPARGRELRGYAAAPGATAQAARAPPTPARLSAARPGHRHRPARSGPGACAPPVSCRSREGPRVPSAAGAGQDRRRARRGRPPAAPVLPQVSVPFSHGVGEASVLSQGSSQSRLPEGVAEK